MHKTNNLDDGYMGSGKLIRSAIKKHGHINFTKEILYVFDNEEDMKNKEKELVILSEQSYNLCDGGRGGFGYINNHKLSGGCISDISRNNLKKGDNPYVNTPEHYGKLKQLLKQKYPDGVWKGKKHSEESKQKMKNKKSQVGSKNSQFGTCWITDGSENKKIHKNELDIWTSKGYRKGRS
jgi:hypothetical protein